MPFLCARCGDAFEGDGNEFNGVTICDECLAEIEDIDTALKFVIDHPKMFVDYLQESLYAPAPYGTRVKEMLTDAAHWSDTCVNPDDHEYMRFSDWVLRYW